MGRGDYFMIIYEWEYLMTLYESSPLSLSQSNELSFFFFQNSITCLMGLFETVTVSKHCLNLKHQVELVCYKYVCAHVLIFCRVELCCLETWLMFYNCFQELTLFSTFLWRFFSLPSKCEKNVPNDCLDERTCVKKIIEPPADLILYVRL